MINPDLTTWSTIGDAAHGLEILQVMPYGSGTSTFEGNMFQVNIKPSSELEFNGVYVWMAGLADGAKLVPGNSYTVSFYLPCGTDIWKAIGEPEGSYKNQFYNNNTALKASWTYLNAALRVGIAYASSLDIDSGIEINTQLFEISVDNIDSYFGKKLTASFVCPDYTGNAYLTFSFAGNSSKLLPFSFYFSDISLIDPNDNSGELKGIKGTLHNLYWGLFGGACGDEDCPHSSEDDPHVSIFVRLFVPSDGALSDFTNKVKSLFSERLGFVYQAFDFLGQVLNKLNDLFSGIDASGIFSFTLPAMSFKFLGYDIKLWDSITLEMDFLSGSSGLGLLYGIYKVCLHGIFIFAILNYADKIYKDIMRSD